MPTFALLRKFFAKRAIRLQAQKAAKRERRVKALGKGVKIGLLFDGDDPGTRKLLENMREWLVKEGAEVTALGFIDEKEFPPDLVFKPGFDYFNRKDLDWRRLAKPEIVQKLNGLDLDYLIGVFTDESLHLLHLAAASRAKFRIGAYRADFSDSFDMMIDLKGSGDLPNLVTLSEHYLKQLKA